MYVKAFSNVLYLFQWMLLFLQCPINKNPFLYQLPTCNICIYRTRNNFRKLCHQNDLFIWSDIFIINANNNKKQLLHEIQRTRKILFRVMIVFYPIKVTWIKSLRIIQCASFHQSYAFLQNHAILLKCHCLSCPNFPS
jgi:hypothetical protein